MKCPNCRKKIPDKAQFCPYCGFKIIKKKNGKIFIFLGSFFFFLIFGLLGIFIYSSLRNNSSDLSGENGISASSKEDDEQDGELNAENTDLHITDLSEENISINSKEDLDNQFDSIKNILCIRNELITFRYKSSNQINDTVYYRYAEYYNDLPVYGTDIVLCSDKENVLSVVSGNYSDLPDINSEPEISLDDITAKYDVSNDSVSLCYYKNENDYRLCYKIDTTNTTFIVDALAGDELTSINNIDYVTEKLSGNSGNVDVNVTEENGHYTLYDQDKNIKVYSADNEIYHDGDSKTLVTYNSADDDISKDAVDVLHNMEIAYDFYNEILGYQSSDGDGEAAIEIVVGLRELNGKTEENNAASTYYNSPAISTFYVGKSDPSLSNQLDVIAHEYTHSVIRATSTLNTKEGAHLNEGLSDIMGEMAEAYSTGTCDWKNICRNAAKPQKSSDSGKHYSKYTQLDAENDDEHCGATILSHAAYLMWTGNISHTPINDYRDMSQLWYRTIMLMNSTATFSDCRTCCEVAALQMINEGILTQKQYECIEWAFDKVSVSTSTQSIDIYGEDNTCYFEIFDSLNTEARKYKFEVLNASGSIVYENNVGTHGQMVECKLSDGRYTIKISDTENKYLPHYEYIVVNSHSKYNPCYYDYGNSNINKRYQRLARTKKIYTNFETYAETSIIDQDGTLIENVNVEVVNLSNNNSINYSCNLSNGKLSMKIEPGYYNFTFKKEGYEDYQIYQQFRKGANKFYEEGENTIVLKKADSNETPEQEDSSSLPDNETISSAYMNFIDHGLDSNVSGYSELAFVIHDVDGDYSPELIIRGKDSEGYYHYFFYKYSDDMVCYVSTIKGYLYEGFYYSGQYQRIALLWRTSHLGGYYVYDVIPEVSEVIYYEHGLSYSSGESGTYRVYKDANSNAYEDISEEEWNEFNNNLTELPFTEINMSAIAENIREDNDEDSGQEDSNSTDSRVAETIAVFRDYGFGDIWPDWDSETGYSNLAVKIDGSTVQDMGDYYLAEARIYKPLTVTNPSFEERSIIELSDGSELILLLHVIDNGIKYYTEPDITYESYYSTEKYMVKGGEVLFSKGGSFDPEMDYFYNGLLKISKECRTGTAITHQYSTMTYDELCSGDFYNGIAMDENGSITDLVFLGD